MNDHDYYYTEEYLDKQEDNKAGVEKVKKNIDEIITQIKSKPIDKKEIKEQIKEIKKIHTRLKQRGMTILKLYEEKEIDKWYCQPCRKKQSVRQPHLIMSRGNEKLYRGFCSVCGAELLKKNIEIKLQKKIKSNQKRMVNHGTTIL